MGDSYFDVSRSVVNEGVLIRDVQSSTSSDKNSFSFSSRFHEDSGYSSKINGFSVEEADTSVETSQDADVTDRMTSRANGQRNGVLKRGHQRDSKQHHVTFSDEPEIVMSEPPLTSSRTVMEQTGDAQAPATNEGHYSILKLGQDGFPEYDVIASVAGVEDVVQTCQIVPAAPLKSVYTDVIDSPSPALHSARTRHHNTLADMTSRRKNVTSVRPAAAVVPFVVPIIRLKRWPR